MKRQLKQSWHSRVVLRLGLVHEDSANVMHNPEVVERRGTL